ncbi:MAG: DNA adenine methylase, partial [Spirochaetales bacterium]
MESEEYHPDVDLRHPYLTRQIIAYIGNKRRLLPFLFRALQRIYGNTIPSGLSFLDLFAGSGVVSRLAKFLGFAVWSNDWEPYAYTLGRAYVETQASDITTLFGSQVQFEQLLSYLNTLSDPPLEEQYFARYYAPREEDPFQADYRTERLFYTRQNALQIDRIRNEIDRLFPPGLPSLAPPSPTSAALFPPKSADRLTQGGMGDLGTWGGQGERGESKERCRHVLIALLLYEAATHTNTSGVFKAYHKGFGGHGKDALHRILQPILLEPPPLIDSLYPCHVFCKEASALMTELSGKSFDVAYLDPPYNQHQYGSNYHLLNTLTLWDKPPICQELDPKGRLKDKAGIRKDWKRTRSAYCYRQSAAPAFYQLLAQIDAEHILISYSTDGIIPFEILMDICSSQGSVRLLTNEYVTYRGGRQSNQRKDHNVEFLLWISQRRGKSSPTR